MKEGIWHIIVNGEIELTVYDFDTAKMDFLDISNEYQGMDVSLVQVLATTDPEVIQGDKFLTSGRILFNGKTEEPYINLRERSWHVKKGV